MKLLHYTSLRHLLFASVLTLVSIPVFYILLNNIFVHSIDRDLRLQAAQIPSILSVIQSPSDFQLWKELDNDLEVVPADSVLFHEKPFTIKKKEPGIAAPEDFRILQKKVQIMGRPYVVNIESSLFEKEDLIQTILTIQLGILLLLLMGTVSINYFIHKRIWAPFYDSLSYLKEFNIESESKTQPQQLKIKEFKELSASIQALSVSVRRAYYSQKEFIENASHELQTPLTILKFKLELLLQQKELSSEQGALIGDMYKEIEQMQGLNSSLLLLSKIENGQFLNEDTVYVHRLLPELIEGLSLLAEAKGQQLQFNSKQAEVIIRPASDMLFRIMLTNLITNAIQYAPNGALIFIELSKEQLSICNPGQAFSLPADKLFKRFARQNKVKTNGNGLGLSIASRIAQYHKRLKMEIHYGFEKGMHCFTVCWENNPEIS